MNTYTEGILEDGACILKNGHMMKIDEIVKELNSKTDESNLKYSEYKNHEFCKAVGCAGFCFETQKCLVDMPYHCRFTAKEFHKWLKANGPIIVKERFKPMDNDGNKMLHPSFLNENHLSNILKCTVPPNGVPCSHPGYLSHGSHPCEGCGRINGKLPEGW